MKIETFELMRKIRDNLQGDNIIPDEISQYENAREETLEISLKFKKETLSEKIIEPIIIEEAQKKDENK